MSCLYICQLESFIILILFRAFIRYEKAVTAMAKQSVTLEVLSYHASASLDDAQRLRVGYYMKIKVLKEKEIIFCIFWHTL